MAVRTVFCHTRKWGPLGGRKGAFTDQQKFHVFGNSYWRVYSEAAGGVPASALPELFRQPPRPSCLGLWECVELEIWYSQSALCPAEAEILPGPPGRPPAAARVGGIYRRQGCECIFDGGSNGRADVYYSHTLSGLTINLAVIHKWFQLNVLEEGGVVGKRGLSNVCL